MRNGRFWLWPLFAVTAVGFGYGLGKLLRGGRSAPVLPIPGWALLPLLIAATFLVLLVHECGHLAGALWSGFRVDLLTVGPFTLVREHGRLRFRWNRILAHAGGLAAATPTPGADLRRGTRNLILAGPLASLTLALASGVVYALSTGAVALTAAGVGGFSLLIGLATAVPAQVGGLYSDGARFLMLRRGGMQAKRWLAIIETTTLAQAGQRPRDWPLAAASAEWADATPDGSVMSALLYYYALDRGRTGDAGRLLDEAINRIDQLPAPLKIWFQLETAWFEAAQRGRPDVARRLFSQEHAGIPGSPWTRPRVEAAILRAEGRLAEATQKRSEAMVLLSQAPMNPSTEFERELLG